MEEIERIKTIVISIIKKDIPIRIEEDERTSKTNFKEIIIGKGWIPEELRKNKAIVMRLMEGDAIHEAGHFIKTERVDKYYKGWRNRKKNGFLAKYVANLIEDKRVNHFLLNRYRYDLAKRLKFNHEVTGKSWKKELIEDIKSGEIGRGRALVSLVAMKVLYGVDVDDVLHMLDISQDERRLFQEACEVLEDAKYTNIIPRLIEKADRLYEIFEMMLKPKHETLYASDIPEQLGGTKPISLDKRLIKSLMEKEGKKKKERKRKKKRKAWAGSGTGLEIPSPLPDKKKYERLVQKNMKEIRRLLSYLKKTQTIGYEKVKWQKKGRLMYSALSKAFVSSLRNRVNHIHIDDKLVLKEKGVNIALVLDLSGSVPIRLAMDILTVIAEVMGNWINDRFAILVFGSEYMKIKAFVEGYNNVKQRIGGLGCLGGTMLANCLKDVHRMFNLVRNGRKILVVASDFEIHDDYVASKAIKEMKRDGIRVIGIAFGTICKGDTYNQMEKVIEISDIRELPEKFIKIYKEVAEE